MIALLFFAFLAGIATVLSPCVLPILPALLSAGSGLGRLRPIGIICGLIVSFIFFTLTLTAIVHYTGLSPDILRYIAIFLIAFFGVAMIFPSIGESFAKITSPIANLGQKAQNRSKFLGTGFWSGFALGAALGLVWTPCAGPILAAITTLVATSAVTFSAFLITFFYVLGAAVPMFLIMFGSKKMIQSSRSLGNYSEIIRKFFGILMILAAVAIALHYDVKLQQIAVQYIPTLSFEDNETVRKELDQLHQNSGSYNDEFILPPEGTTFLIAPQLPRYAKSPDLVGITAWVNSPPLSLQMLRGKVVLIDFWTYSCINCIRTFPYLKKWDEKYKDKGLVIVGVHTPEFEFEKNIQNVKDAVKRFGLLYPIAIDSNYKTWQNFNNKYWPAHYLIDQQGFVRSYHFGEGAYIKTENDIRALLSLPPIEAQESNPILLPITPETYLGFDKAQAYTADTYLEKNSNYLYNHKTLENNQVGLRGNWLVSSEKITSTDDLSFLDLNFIASHVYLVMSSDTPKLVNVYMDGKLLDKKYFTDDMDSQGQLLVQQPRKYDIVDLKGDYGRHEISLKTPSGVSMYAFTFGNE